MDSYTINAYPLHIRHKCRPNTPDEAVAAFMASNPMGECPHYNNCLISPEGCRIRKAEAKEKAKESNGFNIYAKCLECKGVEPMDPKKCHVDGCGKKVLAKGMCSTHYFKQREKEKKAAAGETKQPAPETKTPIPETKAPEPEKKIETPATPAPQKKPENMHENMHAKKIPNENTAPTGTKRVNVQFSGPDVAIWERLRDSAKRNRRDIRTEALYIIESWLREPEKGE